MWFDLAARRIVISLLFRFRSCSGRKGVFLDVQCRCLCSCSFVYCTATILGHTNPRINLQDQCHLRPPISYSHVPSHGFRQAHSKLFCFYTLPHRLAYTAMACADMTYTVTAYRVMAYMVISKLICFLHTAAQIGLYSHGLHRYGLHSYGLQSYSLHGYIQAVLLFTHCRADWPIQPWPAPLRPTQLRPT